LRLSVDIFNREYLSKVIDNSQQVVHEALHLGKEKALDYTAFVVIVYYFAKVFNSLIRERLAGCHDIYFLCVFGCDPQC